MDTAHCIFINCIALAKQGDNAFGSVRPSVYPLVWPEPHELIGSMTGQVTRLINTGPGGYYVSCELSSDLKMIG